jgi:hypothetical protein
MLIPRADSTMCCSGGAYNAGYFETRYLAVASTTAATARACCSLALALTRSRRGAAQLESTIRINLEIKKVLHTSVVIVYTLE